MVNDASHSWAELAFYSLIKNPFLVPSAVGHLLLFYFLGMAVLAVNPDEQIISIPIQLIEMGPGRSKDKSIGPGKGPGGPRSLPKLGTPDLPRLQTGKLDAGSLEGTTPSKDSAPAAESPPPLPKPKQLADAGRPRSPAVKEVSADSLVKLPTRAAANSGTAANPDLNTRNSTAVKGKGEGEGVRALTEGNQLPGALKGTGSGSGPYGVPGGIREGKGVTGGGTGSGTGGGSSSGLRGNSDYGHYLKLIESRVKSVWRYPDGVTGVQKVSVRFALDRAGKLSQVEVVDSTDPRINASALEAMRKASPFPPIPESLKDLAGESLIIRFTVDIHVRG